MRVPWTARRSSQSILKEISPEYSLEGLMLKLKLQYFGHLMGRADSLETTLMLGKIKGRRKRGRHRMRWLDVITKINGHEFEQTLGAGDGQGRLASCSPWGHEEEYGVGCHFLLQGIFPTQGSNLGLPHCRQMLYPLSHQGIPI